MAVWGFQRRERCIQALYGRLVVLSPVVGTPLRLKAAQLGWCTNFGVPCWFGWLAYSSKALFTVTSLKLFSVVLILNSSTYNPDDAGKPEKAGPLAAEPDLRT